MSSVNKKIKINPAVPVGARVEHIYWYTHQRSGGLWGAGGLIIPSRVLCVSQRGRVAGYISRQSRCRGVACGSVC